MELEPGLPKNWPASAPCIEVRLGIPLSLGTHPPKRFDGILSFLEVYLLPFRDWRFFRGLARRRVSLAGSVDVEGRGSGAGVPHYRGGEWGGVADLKS